MEIHSPFQTHPLFFYSLHLRVSAIWSIFFRNWIVLVRAEVSSTSSKLCAIEHLMSWCSSYYFTYLTQPFGSFLPTPHACTCTCICKLLLSLPENSSSIHGYLSMLSDCAPTAQRAMNLIHHSSV